MNNNILMVTFNTEPWNFAVTLDIITKEMKQKNKVTWFLLDNFSLDKKYLPLSNNLRAKQIRRLIDKLIVSEPRLFANLKIINSIDITPKTYKGNKRSREVARAELISRLRDSDPCLSHNEPELRRYSKTYLGLNSYFHSYLSKNKFEMAYVFNGRPLCERAFNDAAISIGQKINYFETFNENWKDRYFVFKKPTHSVDYRSKVMKNFSLIGVKSNPKKYKTLSEFWFDQRIAGITQTYTRKQILSGSTLLENPYYVFFHSSQDELDMVGLTDSYWGNQIHILKILVRIFKEQSNFDLVLRIHPHLMYKSKRDKNVWCRMGEDLESKYSWFKFFGPESSVNSYDLVRQAQGVITSGSTIGVEAAYLKKPSILLGNAFHKPMGITINPRSISELANLIKNSVEIKHSRNNFDAALRYAFFQSQGGLKFDSVEYFGKNQYYINSLRISYSWYVKALRRLELKMKSLYIGNESRECNCDNRVNSSARW